MAIFSEQYTERSDKVLRIYDEIVKRAKQKKVSIRWIEETAGISNGSMCKWNSVSPSARTLKAVADILGCGVDDLLVDVGDQNDQCE